METKKNDFKKYLIPTALLASLLIGYKYYKYQWGWKHLVIFSSKSLLSNLENSELQCFKNSETLPSFLESLKTLPEQVFNKYCLNVIYSKETTSTQTILENHFENVSQGILYVADIQRQGIGRSGNWVSNNGCLMFSFKFECSAKIALPVQMMLPLGIVGAIEKIAADKGIEIPSLKAKWPNDVYLNEKKLSGILVNSKSNGKLMQMTIGIGINISNKSPFINLNEVYPNIFSKGEVLKEFISEFSSLVNDTENPGWEKRLTDQYKAKWLHYMKVATLSRDNKPCTIIDINHEGTIIARDQTGTFHKIQARDDIIFS
ncbi:hypothetical protein SteCoe_25769 [Stentor coeruleus]|uniref:BPL/LPL catalytic domain-containing protein n=1 Tax=Stentor coeruleus TaxID=5963 RepID=A0A1R2BED3_9CILI|nr:hypothetical protein SteCoe_25769 [Stentor coeruleus]